MDEEKGKFAKYLKPPYIYFILGGVVLAAFVLVKKSSGTTTSADTLTYSGDTASGSSAATADDLTEAVSGINDTLDALTQSMTDLQSTESVLYQQTQDNITTLSDVITATNNSLSTEQTLNNSDLYDEEFNNQVSAAKAIKALSGTYTSTQKTFNSDGTISKEEQTALDAIHNQAENISVTAGFGAGGTTGAARVIPDDVKKAAGLS